MYFTINDGALWKYLQKCYRLFWQYKRPDKTSYMLTGQEQMSTNKKTLGEGTYPALTQYVVVDTKPLWVINNEGFFYSMKTKTYFI